MDKGEHLRNPDVLRCVVRAEVGAGSVAEGLAAVEGLDLFGSGALAMVYGMVGDGLARHHAAVAMGLAPDGDERTCCQPQLDGLSVS
ncbi:hypothetical protein BU198_19850 [Streptomyces sp. CBMA156]|nr:hypothetical protein [Streptomyces sp. CBMA156]